MTVLVEDRDRSRKAYEDRMNGMEYAAIGEKYGVSGSRAFQIVKREWVRRNRELRSLLGRDFTDEEKFERKKEIGKYGSWHSKYQDS